jgi:tetratricopeptide (TPR) repeat protein
MKKILVIPIFGIILLSLFSPIALAEKENILFYGKSLGKIEDSLKVNYTITKTQQIPQNISSYRVITIISPDKGIPSEEIPKILDFVNSGGSLVIIAEDFTEASSISQINRIISSMNIEFNVDRVYDDLSNLNYNTNILIAGDDNYPPSKGVSKILYVSGSSLKGIYDGELKSNITSYSKNYDEFETYKKGERPPISGYIKYGNGMILLIGNKSIFEDAYVIQEDNALFTLNLFDFAAGNSNIIGQRLQYKEDYDEEINSFLPYFGSMNNNGFSEIKPAETDTINSLVQLAQNQHAFGLYREAHVSISQALTIFESQMRSIDDDFNEKLQKAKNLESEAKNKGIADSDQAVFDEGIYYLTQAEKENNLNKRLELIDKAIGILENFGQGDMQRAKIEIDTAESKLKEAKKTLFYEADVQRAEELLTDAKKLYNRGKYSDVISIAIESQRYSERAIEKYNIFKIVIGLGLLLGALLLMIITKRILSWKAQKKK